MFWWANNIFEQIRYTYEFDLNLLLGSMAFTYIFAYIKNLHKKSLYNKNIEVNIYQKKRLINGSVQATLLSISSIIFIYFLINQNNIWIFSSAGYMYGIHMNLISLYIISIATFIGLALSIYRLINIVKKKI